MTQDDPYRVLGVPREASADQIRAAFRATMRRQHPDIVGDEASGAATRRAIDAYRLLADPGARARYDASHPEVVAAGRSRPARAVQCPQCRGLGFIRTAVTCSSCGGRAEVTVLSGPRARVLRCRTCSGDGSIAGAAICRGCGGQGVRSEPT